MMSMTRAEPDDAIASLVEQKTRRLPLTHKDMSEWLFGSNCHAASVNAACLRLMSRSGLIAMAFGFPATLSRMGLSGSRLTAGFEMPIGPKGEKRLADAIARAP